MMYKEKQKKISIKNIKTNKAEATKKREIKQTEL